MTDPALERHILYELCVQRPQAVVRLIRSALSGALLSQRDPPLILHEDFCGTGAVAREWVASAPGATAIATDLDPESIAFGRRRADDSLPHPQRITWRCEDVRASHTPLAPADAIFVGNFSIGELHTRAELLAYFRDARARLNNSGILVCDTYGGAAAFRTGLVHRTHPGREPSERILYTWEQRSVDPFAAAVVNALHFRVELAGEIVAQHFDAFIYHWRLWSVPELRDAMLEAGFSSTRIIRELDPTDTPALNLPAPPATDPNEHHIVCVCASA